MLGTSRIEWILIRTAILIFRYTPLYHVAGLLAVCCYILSIPTRNEIPVWSIVIASVLGVHLILETLFYIFIFGPFRSKVNAQIAQTERLGPEERRTLFDKCQGNVSSIDRYISGWFMNAPLEEIRRENLREFLLWGFFDKRYEHNDIDSMTEAERHEVEGFIDEIEERLGQPIKEGRGNAKSLRLTFDNVHVVYRSLTWYLVIFIVDQYTHLSMWLHGYQYYARKSRPATTVFPPRPQTLLSRHKSPAEDLSYWYRPHRSEAKKPLLFLHGVGVGLWLYTNFLRRLRDSSKTSGDDEMGVIALELLPVSSRIMAPPPRKADFIRQVNAIIDFHEWDDFAIASHSYGSTLTTHILLDPELSRKVSSVVLVDPVTLLLHLPDVAYNFTRRQPRLANEWMLWYFASTDPGIALCLGRYFSWRENIVWKESLIGACNAANGGSHTRKAVVCLGGKDIIVNTASVSEYLVGPGGQFGDIREDKKVDVVFFSELGHAEAFEGDRSLTQLVHLIEKGCVRS